MDKQQAYKEMSDLCQQMRALYNQAIQLANDQQIPFDLPWGGEGCSAEDGYGAGATYYPVGVEDWNKNYTDSSEWISSSRAC